jgi:nitrate/TMAO reductase-like tetraheme cytochrome c subunit
MDPLDPHLGVVIVGLLALAFLVWVVFFAGEIAVPQRHWLLLFALVVFPSMAMFLGLGRAMDDAKRPEFCGQCHIMQPWMNDLKDPESDTLAAIHYKNRYILEDQCYTCHSDYTMFGPARAKLAGVNHLVRYVTGAYELPLHTRVPYNVANCAHCHAEAKVFRDAHTDVIEDLKSGEATCLDCHAPAHPDQPGE